MPKITSSFIDVQAWFKNGTYSPASKFNNTEWAEQIAKRVFIDNDLDSLNKKPTSQMLSDIDQKRLSGSMNELILKPLAPFHAGYRNEQHTLQPSAYSTKTVLPLTIPYMSRLHSLYSATTTTPEYVDEWAHKNPHLGVSAFGHLRVDLNGRDEDILADFKYWLLNFRKAINYPSLKAHPKKLEHRFFDWYNNKILQYFDLNAWCRWTGNELTNEQVLELLFKDHDLSKLKTVSQKVAEVIDYRNVIALYNQT